MATLREPHTTEAFRRVHSLFLAIADYKKRLAIAQNTHFDHPGPGRKSASWACTLSSAFTSEATAAASSFGAVFTAAAALEKTSFSSGERRRNSINRNKQIRRNHMSQRIKVCTRSHLAQGLDAPPIDHPHPRRRSACHSPYWQDMDEPIDSPRALYEWLIYGTRCRSRAS